MKKSLLSWIVGVGLVVGTAVRADVHSFAPTEGFTLMAGPAVNLLQYPSDISNVDNRMNLFGYATVEYFFTPMIGFRTGAQLVTRGYKLSVGDQARSATFLDIPFALSIGFGWPSGTARSELALGGFYAANMSKDYEGAPFGFGASIGTSTKTKSYVGLLLMHETVFQVSDHFGMGYMVFGKLPFGAARENGGYKGDKFYEAGLGLVLGWL